MGLTDSNSRQNAEDQYIQYERENDKYEKNFLDIYEKLEKISNNHPPVQLIEKGVCDRPSYLYNDSLANYCPKCGAGVQLFIENKLIKIFFIRNKLYKIYSSNSCANKNNRIKLGTDYRNIETSKDENGKLFYEIGKQKLYLSPRLEDCVKGSTGKFYFIHAMEQVLGRYRKKNFYDNLYSFKYVEYEYENPLQNFQINDALIYYRCIKCHLEYHLIKYSILYFMKDYIEQEEKNQIQKEKTDENVEKEKEKDNLGEEKENELKDKQN